MALIHCPRCSQPIDAAPELAGQTFACPRCSQPLILDAPPAFVPPIRRSRRRREDATTSVIASCVALAVTLSLCGGCWVWWQDAASTPQAPSIEDELRPLAREFIKSKLMYPNNAHFHWFTDVIETPEGRYIVRGKVDALNAFGAKPTLDWEVVYELRGRGPPRRYAAVSHSISTGN